MKYLFAFSLFFLAVVCRSASNVETVNVNWYDSPTQVTGPLEIQAFGSVANGGFIKVTHSLKMSRWDWGGYPQNYDQGVTMTVRTPGNLSVGSGLTVNISSADSVATGGLFRVRVSSYVSPANSDVQWTDVYIQFPSCDPQNPIWTPAAPAEIVVNQPQVFSVTGGSFSFLEGYSVKTGSVTVSNVSSGYGTPTISLTVTATAPGPWSIELNWAEALGKCQATTHLEGTTAGAQTVTIALADTDIERTKGISGKATGGMNGYLFSVISGGVGIIGDSETGDFTITGNTKGPYSIKVWSPAGNGYTISNFATKGGAVVDLLVHKVTLTFDNRASILATEFRIYQGGNIIGTKLVPAGALLIETMEVASSSPVTVRSVNTGINRDGPLLVRDGQSEVETDVGTATPTKIPETTAPPSASTVKPAIPNTTPQPDSTKPVWDSVTTTNSGSAVTAKQSAEGVDKIVGELRNVQRALYSDEAVTDPAAATPPDVTAIDRLSLKPAEVVDGLPDAPVIQMPESVTSATFSSPSFLVNGASYSATYDLSPYSSPIGVFRLIAQGVMYIIFFIVYIKTVRQAFA